MQFSFIEIIGIKYYIVKIQNGVYLNKKVQRMLRLVLNLEDNIAYIR